MTRYWKKNGSGVDTINYSSTTGNLVVNAYGGVGSADGAYTITGASGTDITNPYQAMLNLWKYLCWAVVTTV